MGNHDRNLPVSAQRNELCNRRSQALRAAQLEPATPGEAVVQLGACLALVGPSGMSDDNRAEWLKVAQHTLADLPADLIERGCEVARRKCRFPSEVVPAIIEEVQTAMSLRRYRYEKAIGPQSFVKPEPAPDPEYVDPAEVAALIKSIGNA